MNNLRKLRTERNLSIRDLAEKMDVHFTTIARIERSERRLTPDWIERFSEALGVPPQALSDTPLPGQIPGVRSVPVIGQVAAGSWREAVQEPLDVMAAPVSGQNVFGLRVDGDSMDTVAGAGSIVLVDPDQLSLRDGRYYVVMNGDGETTFKQFRADPARLEPLSSNPEHRTIDLGQSPYTVVGRVVGTYQSFA